MPTNAVPNFLSGAGGATPSPLPPESMPNLSQPDVDPFTGNPSLNMPRMPGEFGDPRTMMESKPTEQPISDEQKKPSFDEAMVNLVSSILPELNEQDLKVLKKLTPDISWVLGKVFGSQAITALQKAAITKNSFGNGAMSNAPQSML